jgi:hypothetical protein
MATLIEVPMAWGLTRGMARALGINLSEAVTEGWFSRRDLGDMVDACGVCDQVTKCLAFLAVPTRTESLPGFCANKARIEALQP